MKSRILFLLLLSLSSQAFGRSFFKSLQDIMVRVLPTDIVESKIPFNEFWKSQETKDDINLKEDIFFQGAPLKPFYFIKLEGKVYPSDCEYYIPYPYLESNLVSLYCPFIDVPATLYATALGLGSMFLTVNSTQYLLGKNTWAQAIWNRSRNLWKRLSFRKSSLKVPVPSKADRAKEPEVQFQEPPKETLETLRDRLDKIKSSDSTEKFSQLGSDLKELFFKERTEDYSRILEITRELFFPEEEITHLLEIKALSNLIFQLMTFSDKYSTYTQRPIKDHRARIGTAIKKLKFQAKVAEK